MALGSHLSFVGGFCWRKQREAGGVSAVTRWNTTTPASPGSCALLSHQSSAQLYKMGCKLCSFWLTDTIKVMCALQHYEFDGERSPETSRRTRSQHLAQRSRDLVGHVPCPSWACSGVTAHLSDASHTD